MPTRKPSVPTFWMAPGTEPVPTLWSSICSSVLPLASRVNATRCATPAFTSVVPLSTVVQPAAVCTDPTSLPLASMKNATDGVWASSMFWRAPPTLVGVMTASMVNDCRLSRSLWRATSTRPRSSAMPASPASTFAFALLRTEMPLTEPSNIPQLSPASRNKVVAALMEQSSSPPHCYLQPPPRLGHVSPGLAPENRSSYPLAHEVLPSWPGYHNAFIRHKESVRVNGTSQHSPSCHIPMT